MPIEIRELVIRAVVEPTERPARQECEGDEPSDQTSLVQACVEETLRILRRQKER